MTITTRTFSREVIARVNQNLIEKKRVNMDALPYTVSASIRATRFTTEQLNRSYGNAVRAAERKTA